MNLQSASPYLTSPTYQNPFQTLTQGGKGNSGFGSSNSVHLSATIEAEYLKADSSSLDFTSQDGDRVTFSSQSLQYQKTVLQIEADGSPEDMNKIVDYIKKQYASMKDELTKSLLKGVNGNVDDTQDASATPPTQDAVPEYWNADNTSQRIVDFATSLLDSFKGKGEDFLAMIKDAIDKGFKEAKDAFGKLPDSVAKLVGDTHDLVMQKLDKWAQDKGFAASSADEGTAESAPAADETVKLAA